MNVNAKFPGSSTDSHIWKSTDIKNVLEKLYTRGHKGIYLLGNLIVLLKKYLEHN